MHDETATPRLDFDRAYVERHMLDFKPARWLQPHLHDVERIPEGAALLVGNHGPLGLDTPILVHALLKYTGRVVRPLGDRLLFKGPMRILARMTASVKASPEAARALLARGEWVLVYPGGARETKRSPEERYQLRWEGRLGFIRVAVESGVPIVPVACIGNDDAFVQLRSREQVARSWLGKGVEALFGADYVVPLYFPALHAVRLDYHFGAPIVLTPPKGGALSDAWLGDAQEQVKRALEGLLEANKRG